MISLNWISNQIAPMAVYCRQNWYLNTTHTGRRGLHLTYAFTGNDQHWWGKQKKNYVYLSFEFQILFLHFSSCRSDKIGFDFTFICNGSLLRVSSFVCRHCFTSNDSFWSSSFFSERKLKSNSGRTSKLDTLPITCLTVCQLNRLVFETHECIHERHFIFEKNIFVDSGLREWRKCP